MIALKSACRANCTQAHLEVDKDVARSAGGERDGRWEQGDEQERQRGSIRSWVQVRHLFVRHESRP